MGNSITDNVYEVPKIVVNKIAVCKNVSTQNFGLANHHLPTSDPRFHSNNLYSQTQQRSFALKMAKRNPFLLITKWR